jgi:hypothetical protein
MLIVADTHVHLYPSFDLSVALDAAFENLGKLVGSERREGGTVKVVCLTERYDCHMFKALREGRASIDSRYSLHHHGDAVLMVSRDGGEELLLIVAGRQVVTRERLEVLALTTDAEIPDGLSIDETIARVREVGGVPVVTWAAGKWLFRRGRIVRRVLGGAEKGSVVIGDSSLRPAGWREPKTMQLGRARGLRIIAGTDPLPVVGEEWRIGTYGVIGESDFNWRDPLGSIRSLLLSAPSLRIVGQRGDFKTVWSRLMAHRRTKKGLNSILRDGGSVEKSPVSAQCA